jgi:hypothetical protein
MTRIEAPKGSRTSKCPLGHPSGRKSVPAQAH